MKAFEDRIVDLDDFHTNVKKKPKLFIEHIHVVFSNQLVADFYSKQFGKHRSLKK